MELLGTHKVSFEEIRSLAIQCHALDISAYHLFVDSTHEDKGDKTNSTYRDVFTRQLLSLAIALRTKFYQGLDHKSTTSYVIPCGLLYKYKKNVEENVYFSIKDVCDKIIHADSISRPMEKGVEKPTTTLRGKDNRDKSEWELSMSVNLFAEAVLNWAQDVEENLAEQSTGRAKGVLPPPPVSKKPDLKVVKTDREDET